MLIHKTIHRNFCILLLTCLLGSSCFAQSGEYVAIDNEIRGLIQDEEWNDVLDRAPDLISTDTSRAEGYYYIALAYYNLEQYDDAWDYLAKADARADDDLLEEKIEDLIALLQDADDLARSIKYIEKLEAAGEFESAAESWKELWEYDKTMIAYAYKAVQHYINLKMYRKALEILDDKVFARNQAAQKVIADINNTPEMKALIGYETAMEKGTEAYYDEEYAEAIVQFERALDFMPDDYEAEEFLMKSEDELAWQKAVRLNTIAGYEDYLESYTLQNHATGAHDILKRSLMFYGRKYAVEKDLPEMAYYLKKYVQKYPYSKDADTAKLIMCNAYYDMAVSTGKEKSEYAQTKAIEYYKSAKEYCPKRVGLDNQISRAEKLQIRYGRPDLYQMSFVYDQLSTYGFSAGTLNNTGAGVYGTWRGNNNMFTSGQSYTVNNAGKFSSSSGTSDLTRTSEVAMGNLEFVLGITAKLFDPIWFHIGTGVSINTVFWQYENPTSPGFYVHEWVKNTDQSKLKPCIETGLIINLGGLILRTGVKTQNFADWNFTLGIGLSGKRD